MIVRELITEVKFKVDLSGLRQADAILLSMVNHLKAIDGLTRRIDRMWRRLRPPKPPKVTPPTPPQGGPTPPPTPPRPPVPPMPQVPFQAWGNFFDGIKQSAQLVQGIGLGLAGFSAGFTGLALKEAGNLEGMRVNMGVLLQSTQKGDEMMSKIVARAEATSFDPQDYARSAQTMLAFGVSADKILPSMDQLADISLGNTERFQRLSLAFSQTAAAGRLTGQDLLQYVNAGFNPLQIMSEKTGKSLTKLREEMSEGKISFEMVTEAMKQATSEGGRFSGGMKKGAETLNGQIGVLKGNFQSLMAMFGEEMLPLAKKIVAGLTGVVKWFKNLSPEVKNFIFKAIIALGILGAIVATIATIGLAVGAIVASIMALPEAVGVVIVAILANISRMIVQFFAKKAILLTIVGLTLTIKKYWEKITGWITKAWEMAGKLAQSLYNMPGQIGAEIKGNIGIMGQNIANTIQGKPPVNVNLNVKNQVNVPAGTPDQQKSFLEQHNATLFNKALDDTLSRSLANLGAY